MVFLIENFEDGSVLPNGIPSHHTFNRTISAIDPKVLKQRFISWVQTIVSLNPGEVVNIDGKRLCRSVKDSKESLKAERT